MKFRTLEISKPAELHLSNKQLEIATETENISIPIEDLSCIYFIGPDIRISTMAISQLVNQKILLCTLDNKYKPTAIIFPYQCNSRMAKVLNKQIHITTSFKNDLWKKIVYQKIDNQIRNLSLLGLSGVNELTELLSTIDETNINYLEATTAKKYFANYHPGLNRRVDEPINSKLNYGYSIVRSAIIRSLVSCGFNPAIGLHHKSQLNMFNLADDCIEPYRAIVELCVYTMNGNSLRLSKAERLEITEVLNYAIEIDGTKMNVINSITIMCESLKNAILNKDISKLKLPTILPKEIIRNIKE